MNNQMSQFQRIMEEMFANQGTPFASSPVADTNMFGGTPVADTTGFSDGWMSNAQTIPTNLNGGGLPIHGFGQAIDSMFGPRNQKGILPPRGTPPVQPAHMQPNYTAGGMPPVADVQSLYKIASQLNNQGGQYSAMGDQSFAPSEFDSTPAVSTVPAIKDYSFGDEAMFAEGRGGNQSTMSMFDSQAGSPDMFGADPSIPIGTSDEPLNNASDTDWLGYGKAALGAYFGIKGLNQQKKQFNASHALNVDKLAMLQKEAGITNNRRGMS